jgi:hypothetical protein
MKNLLFSALLFAFTGIAWADETRLVCAGSYVSSGTYKELNVHSGQFDTVSHSETVNLRYEVAFDEAQNSLRMSGFSCLRKKDLVDGWGSPASLEFSPENITAVFKTKRIGCFGFSIGSKRTVVIDRLTGILSVGPASLSCQVAQQKF